MNVSDNETRAVFLNLKENRVLEKNIMGLNLEQGYSISLINMDHKILKVHFKKTRERVSKIKSHLSVADIEELKKLDEEGRLGIPENVSRNDSSIRIAAAAKRLKLLPRSKSAVPRIGDSAKHQRIELLNRLNSSGTPGADVTPRTPGSARTVGFANIIDSNRSKTSIGIRVEDESKQRRSNSVGKGDKVRESNPTPPPQTGRSSRMDMGGRKKSVDIKLPQPEEKSSSSDNEAVSGMPVGNVSAVNGDVKTDVAPSAVSANNNVNKSMDSLKVPSQSHRVNSGDGDPKIRPFSVPANRPNNFKDGTKGKRPSTTIPMANEARRKSVADIRRTSQLLAEGKTRTPFSSHDVKEIERKAKERRDYLSKPFRSIRDGIMAGIENEKPDNSIGEDLHKEMKKGILLGEIATSLYLEDKIDNFMERIDSYVKSNPTKFEPEPDRVKTAAMLNKEIKDGKKAGKPKRNQQRRHQLKLRLQDRDNMPKMTTEDLWEDMNKCRYLRVPEEMIDLSGLNTLVKDQFKMLDMLRQGDVED